MRGAYKGSRMNKLSQMEVGDRLYFDTTLRSYGVDMRTLNPPLSRRPDHMKGWNFRTSLFTAVSASKAGEVRLLVCVERTE